VISPETRMMGLPYGKEIMIVGRTMWTQCTSVTDRRTDRRTDRITITETVQRRASHGKNETMWANKPKSCIEGSPAQFSFCLRALHIIRQQRIVWSNLPAVYTIRYNYGITFHENGNCRAVYRHPSIYPKKRVGFIGWTL